MSDEIIGNHVEIWKPVPSSNGRYSASDLGRIRTHSDRWGRDRILKSRVGRKGYCFAGHDTCVHSAVAEAFLGSKPEGKQINHINGDKTDNRPENLEYVTCLENIRHCWANGLHGGHQGERSGKAKLTENDVWEIRASYPFESMGSIARRHKVSIQNISMIVNRKTWTHI
jgi:hypothetical protein